MAALALAVLLAGTALPPPAGAADPAPPIAVQLNGASRPGLSRAAVEALPAKEITVAFQTEKGEERARYTGALLWDALAAAGLVATQGKHPELHQFAVITGSDGYFVVVSLGEIAPDFGAVPMLLAYARDGAPLPPEQGLRLVVPGDSRGARSVRTLARLDILTLGATP
ncbi:molybdopterin-dependent oxidoreductase [Ancylobacter lacus]|nr:molybdopterin-dependent oxidoreductase [Ancylobacter lacus]